MKPIEATRNDEMMTSSQASALKNASLMLQLLAFFRIAWATAWP